MKQLPDVLATFESQAIDGRDTMRLAQFVTDEQLPLIGLSLAPKEANEERPPRVIKEWTRDNVITQLEGDLNFAFEKALNQRGISASCMYGVIRMWNNILEEGLEDMDDYTYYGLPLLKATAVKYGFDNPIGDDTGSENEYNA